MGIFGLFKNKNNSEENIQKVDMEVIDGATFFMKIEDVFFINGKGLIATGIIDLGTISVGDAITIINSVNKAKIETKVIEIDMFMKRITTATKGDRVGIALEGLSKTDIDKGDILYK